MEFSTSLDTCYLLEVIEDTIRCIEWGQIEKAIKLLYGECGAYHLLNNIIKSKEIKDGEIKILLDELIITLLELDFLFTKSLMF